MGGRSSKLVRLLFLRADVFRPTNLLDCCAVSADMHMATEKHIKAVPALVSAASQSQSEGSLFGGQTPTLATPEKRKISFATQ